MILRKPPSLKKYCALKTRIYLAIHHLRYYPTPVCSQEPGGLIFANNHGIKLKKRGAGGVTEAGERALGGVRGKGAIAPFQPCKSVALVLYHRGRGWLGLVVGFVPFQGENRVSLL